MTRSAAADGWKTFDYLAGDTLVSHAPAIGGASGQ